MTSCVQNDVTSYIGLKSDNNITSAEIIQDNVPEEIPDWLLNNQYISIGTIFQMFMYSSYIVNPIIGILGVVGNVISFIVLRKCGLEQSSNILLFCLTIADMLCLLNTFLVDAISYNNFFTPRGLASYSESLFIAIAVNMIDVVSLVGFRASTYITVCITVERLIAVFYPLQFSTLVTPKIIWLVGLSTFLLWIPWVIYIRATEMHFEYCILCNISQFIIFNTGKQDELYQIFRLNFFPNLTHTVPFIFVTIGSVVISLKLSIALRKRRKLTAISYAQKSPVRTTRTLLLVCLVFSITHAAYSVTTIYEPDDSDKWFTVFLAFISVRQAFVYANSSFNFIIYVALNKKFRKMFTGLFIHREPR